MTPHRSHVAAPNGACLARGFGNGTEGGDVAVVVEMVECSVEPCEWRLTVYNQTANHRRLPAAPESRTNLAAA